MDKSVVSESLEGIAIIGMVGRFPGAKNVDEFWQNLKNGVESISFFSDQELEESGIEPALFHNPNYVRARAVLEDIELFDASFFGFNPREAAITDPQHRLFLECAWEALESAGYNPETYEGSIGVYGGSSGISTYFLNNLYSNGELRETVGDYQISISNDKDFISTRVSYKLNLKGPSITVQTACSTSLVAIGMACQSLLNYQCDMALAGASAIGVPQKTGYLYQEGMILSPDGHCRPFDAKAQGTLGGSGVGIVVLKRLEDAIADGDYIHAVIKGSAINNDGSLKIGYTAPSIDGQAEVIAQALATAEFDPETISYIEAHGTGTPLGDPIEIAALTQVFRAGTQKKGFCAIGSVKSNIGHLDTAASVTGLIKTVQALKHKLLPPSLHFEVPNPKIDFANSPFYVNSTLSEWKTNGTPRRAGVSSFGIGGTNAHVVLEEAPLIEDSGESRPWQMLLLSAKTSTALETATTHLVEHLKQNPALNLADVAYTLQIGRKGFNHRRMVVCNSLEDAVNTLSNLDQKRVFTNSQDVKERPVVFMFSGQGSQYVKMALELYEKEPTFRDCIDQCSEILKPYLKLDLRHILYPKDEQIEEATLQLKQTAITQPALFTIEYALSQLWLEWGVRPAAMIGHSIGEYVAACLAGVFSLEDALILVAKRGQLMQQMPPGSMLAVPLPENEVQPLLGDQLSLAVINGKSSCVVAGTADAIEALQQKLFEQGVECRCLHTSHAFHSQMMEPILEPFTNLVKKVTLKSPQIPYISNVTGTWITAAQATNPSYWATHLRQTVRFADGLQELLKKPEQILLEIGPGRTLTTLAKQHPNCTADCIVLSSLRHPQDRQSDVAFLLNTFGKLWLTGIQVNWSGFYADERRYRLPLPTYPFERQRHWIEAKRLEALGHPILVAKASSPAANSDPVAFSVSIENTISKSQISVCKKPDIADWFYLPSWKRSMLPAHKANLPATQSCWLVFADGCGLGEKMVKHLEQQNQDVITVKVGEKFASQRKGIYSLNPQHSEDYHALLTELRTQNKIPNTILHLWSLTPADSTEVGIQFLETSQNLGFYSLMFLAQAIGKQSLTDELQIAVVSNNIQEVTGEEVLLPEKATILGPCKVIPQEYPNITCHSIDIVLPESGSRQEEKLINHLLAELHEKQSGLAIAYRGNHRWLQTFEPVRLDGTVEETPRLKEGGVYLITGGLGGIGLELAEYLAQTVKAKLVLIGRSAIPEDNQWEQWLSEHDEQDTISRKIRKLQAIKKLGAEVLVVAADVANIEQMQKAIAQACERFGKIDGAIHAAGIAPAGMIQLKTPEMTENLLAPKVKGTFLLDALLKDFNLDFLVLCSSLNSILVAMGVVDHCAANAFLDAFAHRNTTRSSTFTVSINWDGWQEVGQAANTAMPAELKQWREENLKHAILPKEGVDAFSRILKTSQPQVLVSTQDLLLLVQHHASKGSLFLEAVEKANQSKLIDSRPQLKNAYVAPRNSLEQTIAGIWQKCLGIEQVGVYDDFFELGGDSLLAVHLLSKLSEATQTKLSPHSLLEAPTIAALAELIEETPSAHKLGNRIGNKALPPSLVEIQAGTKQPLFLVHPAGGHVYLYRDLAQHLGSDQPVYGLQSHNTNEGADAFTPVEEMAAHYIEALRVVQPEGPYFLGGSSFGGSVAFEMAQQLQAKGQKVALLTLIDTPGWGYMPAEQMEDNEVKVMAYSLGLAANISNSIDHLRQMGTEEQLRYFLEQGRTALRIPESFGLSELRQYHQLFKGHVHAMRNYIPQAYSGKIIFFRAGERDAFNSPNPELGWVNLAAGGLQLHEVSGNHITMHFPPHVQAIAKQLKAYLVEAQVG